MNHEQKAIAAFLVTTGFSAYAVGSFLKFRKEQRSIRAQLKVNTDREIVAIWKGAARVTEMIRQGKYDQTGIDGIQHDFKFEQIVAYNEQ